MDSVLLTKPTNNKLTLLQMSAQRVKDGVEIHAKSDVFQRYFSQYERSTKRHNFYYIYHVPNYSNNKYNRAFAYPELNIMLGGEIPNLSFLRYDGVNNGITTTFNTVYTSSEIRKYMKLAKTFALDFFNEVIKPSNYQFDITFNISDNLEF
jgi:hypothetical protein